jgi:hypothetical protein
MEIIMADEAYFRKVVELQTEFFKRLETRDSQPRAMPPSLLVRLLECDDEIIDLSLGNIGRRLKGFAEEVDFTHPDLYTIFDGALVDGADFSQDCLELLSLAEFARSKQLVRIMPMLGKIITRESLGRNVVRRIDSPASVRMHVRLLKDPDEREEIRSTKKMQVIDLTSIYKKGEDAWRAQPDNFRRFLRFDTAYQDEIARAEKKATRYNALGCSALAEEIMKSVEAFREHMDQAYYGFNRITMTNAAVVLAKSLGYIYNPPPAGALFAKDEQAGKIVVSRKFFGNYNFDPAHNPIEYSPIVSESAGTPVFTQRYALPFLYEPRVYPLHQFWDIAPEGVLKTVRTLECFPDADDKPIFDHFGLIVPSIGFPPASSEETYSFIDDKGLCRTFSQRESAMKELDTILIRNGHFHPIIVGEKDGKCYFISYWV